ncbi:MAG: cytochrome c oxidase assembly protein subunit 15 [Sphingobacteriales bacterium]|jgi:cytochrome c oxidase assembly protein subunit 15
MLFLVILAGGIVRSTGAGMGCPDWPMCFDRVVPPTDISQLPANYQEIYADRGYSSMEFNVVKTWTEYINRLIGALTGLALLICTFFAIKIRKTNKKAFFLTIAALVAIVFQGWLGGQVVAYELLPFMVTIHMLVALVIIGLMIWAILSIKGTKESISTVNSKMSLIYGLSIVAILLLFVQIVFGTQVREQINVIAKENGFFNRASWITDLGSTFHFHRTGSIVYVLINVALFVLVRKLNLIQSKIGFYHSALLAFIGLQMLSGILLNYFGFPPAAQTIHLFFSSVIFGLQFYMLIKMHQLQLISKKGVGNE